MSQEISQVKSSLSTFVDQALKQTPEGYFSSEFDPDWRSACEVKQEAQQTLWKPCENLNPLDFSGMSKAAEAAIHPDIQAYYGAFWSGNLQAKSVEGPVTLIQLWNSEDFDRLIENLVGHLFSQIRAKRSFTVFFANTDLDSELFLSIDNASGMILLEEPEKAPIKVVESNLATFLDRLEPDLTEPKIY